MKPDELRAAVALAWEQHKETNRITLLHDELQTYEKLVFEYGFRRGVSVGIGWSKAEACKLIGSEG